MSAISGETIERFMVEALDLAARGRFRVEPNPTVGAIVLDAEGGVAGRAFHAQWGGPHAEAAALVEAGDRARGGTMIVTLEPCAHSGKKTPPCVPEVIAAGIARVVVGCEDPNRATSGRAAAAFAAAGIAYECGVAEERCRASIARYERHLAAERPWIVAKWAMSADGRIADAAGAARWISGEPSRRVVHELRGAADAVIVGRGTVDADDPSLTSRAPGSRQPLRVVVDSMLSVEPTAKVIATARETATLVICSDGADPARRARLEELGAIVATAASDGPGRVSVDGVVRELARRGVRRALVESGGRLTASFLRAGLVDQAAVFVAPVFLGAGPSPGHGAAWPITDAPRLEEARVTPVGDDALVEGFWPSKSFT